MFIALGLVALVVGLIGMELAVQNNLKAGLVKLTSTGLFFGLSIVGTILFPSIGMVILSVGFLLSVIGDYFLSYLGKDEVFIYGALSFLIGYVLFGVSFLFKTLIINEMIIIPLITLIGFSIFQFLFLKAGDKTIPIAVYLLAQVFLVSMAILTGNWMIVIGTSLLYISDSVIAHQLFNPNWPFKNAYQYLIMPTYYTGLFLIICSIF
jgi:uncharacterized membrane protein YhhN